MLTTSDRLCSAKLRSSNAVEHVQDRKNLREGITICPHPGAKDGFENSFVEGMKPKPFDRGGEIFAGQGRLGGQELRKLVARPHPCMAFQLGIAKQATDIEELPFVQLTRVRT